MTYKIQKVHLPFTLNEKFFMFHIIKFLKITNYDSKSVSSKNVKIFVETPKSLKIMQDLRY